VLRHILVELESWIETTEEAKCGDLHYTYSGLRLTEIHSTIFSQSWKCCFHIPVTWDWWNAYTGILVLKNGLRSHFLPNPYTCRNSSCRNCWCIRNCLDLHAGFLVDLDVSEAVPVVTFIFLFLLFWFSSSCMLYELFVSIAALAVFCPFFVPESMAKCTVGNGDMSVTFSFSQTNMAYLKKYVTYVSQHDS